MRLNLLGNFNRMPQKLSSHYGKKRPLLCNKTTPFSSGDPAVSVTGRRTLRKNLRMFTESGGVSEDTFTNLDATFHLGVAGLPSYHIAYYQLLYRRWKQFVAFEVLSMVDS